MSRCQHQVFAPLMDRTIRTYTDSFSYRIRAFPGSHFSLVKHHGFLWVFLRQVMAERKDVLRRFFSQDLSPGIFGYFLT